MRWAPQKLVPPSHIQCEFLLLLAKSSKQIWMRFDFFRSLFRSLFTIELIVHVAFKLTLWLMIAFPHFGCPDLLVGLITLLICSQFFYRDGRGLTLILLLRLLSSQLTLVGNTFLILWSIVTPIAKDSVAFLRLESLKKNNDVWIIQTLRSNIEWNMFRKTKENKEGNKKANTIASNAKGSERKVSKETKKSSKKEESESATSTTSRNTYQPLHTQRSVSEEERSNEEKRMRDVRPWKQRLSK